MFTTALDYKTALLCAKNQPYKWDLIFIFNSEPTSEQYHYFNETKRHVNRNSSCFFDDIDCPLYPYISPSELEIKSIIKFAMGKNNIMVCCTNGITRSVSVAYIIRCIEEDPKIAINSITKKNCHPNELIIRLGADYLKNEEIFSVYEESCLSL